MLFDAVNESFDLQNVMYESVTMEEIVAEGFTDMIKSAWTTVKNFVINIFKNIKKFILSIINKIKSFFGIKTSDSKATEDELAKTKKELADAKAKNEETEKRLQSTGTLAVDRTNETVKLTAEINKLKKELADAKSSGKTSKAKIDELQQKLDDQTARLQAAGKLAVDRTNETVKLKGQLDAANKRIADANSLTQAQLYKEIQSENATVRLPVEGMLNIDFSKVTNLHSWISEMCTFVDAMVNPKLENKDIGNKYSGSHKDNSGISDNDVADYEEYVDQITAYYNGVLKNVETKNIADMLPLSPNSDAKVDIPTFMRTEIKVLEKAMGTIDARVKKYSQDIKDGKTVVTSKNMKLSAAKAGEIPNLNKIIQVQVKLANKGIAMANALLTEGVANFGKVVKRVASLVKVA